MLIVASVMTPTDIIGMTLMMLLPLIALYEAGILLSAMVQRKRIESAPLIVPIAVMAYEMRERLATALDRRRAREARGWSGGLE
jgi:Sec-independent protein secretion pathway component TatC